MNNQYFNVRPITCPVCGNTELAYVTEAHKCLGFRITNMILAPFIFLSIIVGIIQAITYDASSALPNQSPTMQFLDAYTLIIIAVILTIAFVVFQILIFVGESKTHVCAICSKCGKIWNIN